MVIISARYLWDISWPSNFAKETPSTPTQINSNFLSIRGIMPICVTAVHVSHGSPSWREFLSCAPFPLSPRGKQGSEQTVHLVFLCRGAVGSQKRTQNDSQKCVEGLRSHPFTAMIPHNYQSLHSQLMTAVKEPRQFGIVPQQIIAFSKSDSLPFWGRSFCCFWNSEFLDKKVLNSDKPLQKPFLE